MKSLDKDKLIQEMCPPLSDQLCKSLLLEFLSMEKRYFLRDWEPATLDGGQFAEAAARIIYHADAGTLNTRKSVNKCLKYVEDPTGQNQHKYPDRKSVLHIAKVIRTIYKFRSDRGAIHIDPVYTSNQLDSKLLIENSRWILSEILRIFWKGDRARISRIIRELLRYEVPSIGEFGDKLLVQRTDCTVEEEILILLHYAGESGMSRNQLGEFIKGSQSAITKALRRLISKSFRQVIHISSGNYIITDRGIKRVIEELAPKLLL